MFLFNNTAVKALLTEPPSQRLATVHGVFFDTDCLGVFSSGIITIFDLETLTCGIDPKPFIAPGQKR